MLLKLLCNVLSQGHCLLCFYHLGRCVIAEMIVFLVIFFEYGKLLPSLLSLLLGLIMRNCEDYLALLAFSKNLFSTDVSIIAVYWENSVFNGPKLIITYYFYLCVVALVSWAEMFHVAGAIAEDLRYFRKTTKNKLMFCPNSP